MVKNSHYVLFIFPQRFNHISADFTGLISKIYFSAFCFSPLFFRKKEEI